MVAGKSPVASIDQRFVENILPAFSGRIALLRELLRLAPKQQGGNSGGGSGGAEQRAAVNSELALALDASVAKSGFLDTTLAVIYTTVVEEMYNTSNSSLAAAAAAVGSHQRATLTCSMEDLDLAQLAKGFASIADSASDSGSDSTMVVLDEAAKVRCVLTNFAKQIADFMKHSQGGSSGGSGIGSAFDDPNAVEALFSLSQKVSPLLSEEAVAVLELLQWSLKWRCSRASCGPCACSSSSSWSATTARPSRVARCRRLL